MSFLERLDPGMPVVFNIIYIAAIVAIVVAAAELLTILLRRSGPRLRHDIWLAALMICTLSPALVALVNRAGIVVLPIVETTIVLQEPQRDLVDHNPAHTPQIDARPGALPFADPAIVIDRPIDESPVISPAPATIVTERSWSLEWSHVRGFACLIWCVVAVFLALRLVVGFISLARLKRTARPIDSEIIAPLLGSIHLALGSRTALPEMMTSDGLIEVPIAAGVWRPVVIVPIQLMNSLNSEQLRDVLVHECAHAMRRDGLVGLLQRLTTIAFWPHLMIWWLNRRLAVTREEICDEYVIHQGDATRYAESLLNLAVQIGNKRLHSRPAPGMLESTSGLERRVMRILEPRRTPLMRPNRWLSFASTLLLLVLAFLAAGVRPVARATPQAPQAGAQPKPFHTTVSGTVVDEAGEPVAGARVEAITSQGEIATAAQSNADGQFNVNIAHEVPGRSGVLSLRALHGDRQLGAIELYLSDTPRTAASRKEPDPLRLVMKPTRPVRIRVVDGDGGPVSAATVLVQLVPPSLPTPAGKTGDDGTVNYSVPAGLNVKTVVAYKPSVGFEYVEMNKAMPATEFKPLPDELTLTFAPDSVQTVRFRAVDPENKPVAGAYFVANLWKPGRLDRAATYIRIDDGVTGADGIQTLTFFPKKGKAIVGANASTPKLRSESFYIENDTNLNEIQTASFKRFEKLSGLVTDASGAPVARAFVTAQGYVATLPSGHLRQQAITDKNGRYEMYIAADASHLIFATAPQLASAPASNVIVRGGEPVPDANFHLGPGTRVHGQLPARDRVGSGDPRPKFFQTTVTVLGREIPEPYRQPSQSKALQRESLTLVPPIDENGRYEITLAAGDYKLEGSPAVVHVDGTGELVHNVPPDSNRPAAARREVTGTLIDVRPGTGGKPLAGLRVTGFSYRAAQGMYPNAFYRERSVITATDGRFSINLAAAPGVLEAHTTDQSLAALVDVPVGTDKVELRLAPTAEITGRFVDPTGRPVSGVIGSLQMIESKRGVLVGNYGRGLEIGPDGRFKHIGVIVGEKHEIWMRDRAALTAPTNSADGKPVVVKTITLDRPGVQDLGDIVYKPAAAQ